MIEPRASQSLQMKVMLRDVHPAVWRRVALPDALSIADLHQVLQLLIGWDDDHLHRFHIHGHDYGVAHGGGLTFAENAAAVPLSRFQFHPTERLLYGYDFTAGWQVEVRVESLARPGSRPEHPFCVAGQEAAPPDGCGGPSIYAERRLDALGWDMGNDMEIIADFLRRVGERDATALVDPEFERAVSRLKAREPFLARRFERRSVNAALRQAFSSGRGSP
jgi:hypothetical protein